MKISELSDLTGVSRPTLKYYLREGLLHSGRPTSRTQAEYDESHVDRVRLVRALIEAGGLSLERVRQVLAVLGRPGLGRIEVMAAAQSVLVPASGKGADEGAGVASSRAWDWLQARGWQVEPGGPLVQELDRVWTACEQSGVVLDEQVLDDYADAVERVAGLDLDSVPADPQGAVRQVVLGTLLMDPVLACLRRLAQQHVAVSRFGIPDQG